MKSIGPKLHISNLSRAWFAGLFDGEGSVTLALGRYVNKKGRRVPRLLVTMTQKNPPFLRFCKRVFPGAYINGLHCRWEYANAERVLRFIRYDVRLKSKAIEIGLAHRDLVRLHPWTKWKGCGKGTPMPTWLYNKHISLRKQLMRENARR